MGKIFSDQCHLSIKKSGMSIVYIEGSDAIISKIIIIFANMADPDEMSHHESCGISPASSLFAKVPV